VAVMAAVIATNAYYPALVNEYIINGDVPTHIYWMQQFNDTTLFKDDLLTDFAKHIQPWGVVQVYYWASAFADPLWLSKVLPIVLFVPASVYLFKLVRVLSGTFAGFLAASLFMVMPISLGSMASGSARTFGYPLTIMFLYFLITKNHFKASVVMVAQTLFYPIVFCVSAITFALSFLTARRQGEFGDKKGLYFAAAATISVTIMMFQHVLMVNPSIGTAVRRTEMINAPEYYKDGRLEIIPTPSLVSYTINMSTAPYLDFAAESFVYSWIRSSKPPFVKYEYAKVVLFGAVIFCVWFLSREVVRGEIVLPAELLYLCIAAGVMYKIADILLFKLYFPQRYIEYAIPVLGVILGAITIDRLLAKALA
jgi:hypothetical protein